MPIESHIGKTLTNPVTNPQLSPTDLSARWDNVQKMRRKGATSLLSDGTNLNHTYLEYVPGLATYCTIGPNPVWTGDMSGCLLFRFRLNGKLCAGHVGTDTTDAQKNQHAKAAWRAFCARPDVTDVMGYDPANDQPAATFQRVVAAQRPMSVTGWWEPNGAMRIVTLVGFHGDWRKKEIFAVDIAPLQPWSVLQNHTKFRVMP